MKQLKCQIKHRILQSAVVPQLQKLSTSSSDFMNDSGTLTSLLLKIFQILLVGCCGVHPNKQIGSSGRIISCLDTKNLKTTLIEVVVVVNPHCHQSAILNLGGNPCMFPLRLLLSPVWLPFRLNAMDPSVSRREANPDSGEKKWTLHHEGCARLIKRVCLLPAASGGRERVRRRK